MKRVRVLVVEDSLTIRRRFCDILEADPDLQVVGECADGKRAIELCEQLRPDVITLDMVMPMMTGLSATEHIMAYMPTPILVVSASTNRGELFKTYDVLAAGALDVLEKPSLEDSDGDWERRFVAAIKLIARIKVITHPRARLNGDRPAPTTSRATPFAPTAGSPIPADTARTGTFRLPVASPTGSFRTLPGAIAADALVAIGASTGGPAAIVTVLRALPAGLPVPIFFVLHIDEPFGTAFAEWLDDQTAHRVAYAREGDHLDSLRGRVLMAPPGRHLRIVGGRVQLGTDCPRHSCRPSVDVLFESLAVDCGSRVLACLLTGMGRDGASGLLDIRRAGGTTIAQDETSSVVYGMPREAALLNAAQLILPLDRIGPEMVTLLGKRRGNAA